MTAVRVRSLTVRYDKATILDGVDADIRDGEFFTLLGPSGCGKTTLLRAIAGFVEPAGGEIRFDERPMNGVPTAERDCGMVFQNYALWPHLTVAENVAFGLDVRKVPKPDKARRVAEALQLVRMQDFADRPPNRLSGGQQQRVALARALVVDPQVLLLDEPLSNLDAQLRVDLRAEIREIQRRTRRTAVYVTHDRAEALALADRIAVLRAGKIEQIGTPAEVYERPATPFVASFVGDANRCAARAAGVDGGRVLLEGPFGRVLARATGSAGALATGAAAEVMTRPERLRLTAGADGGVVGRLAGRVVRCTFLGELVQHDVAIQGGSILRVLALGGAPAFDENAVVTVHVDDALAFAAP